MEPSIEDFENKIIDEVVRYYSGLELKINISSEFEDVPEEFPALMVRQTGASVYSRTQDDSLSPHHYNVTIQLDTFSNKTSSAKSEVKSLMKINNQIMESVKLTLISSELFTNYDRTITRGTQVYKGIVGAPKEINGDFIYQVYR